MGCRQNVVGNERKRQKRKDGKGSLGRLVLRIEQCTMGTVACLENPITRNPSGEASYILCGRR
jgi:hypothetical protein